jgi:hypothetical protein
MYILRGQCPNMRLDRVELARIGSSWIGCAGFNQRLRIGPPEGDLGIRIFGGVTPLRPAQPFFV